jgi:hypothetical protein
MTTTPEVWQAVGVRALIGLAVLLVMVVGLAGYVVGSRAERKRTRR